MSSFKEYTKEILLIILIFFNIFVWYVVYWSPDGTLKVYFLDIGQGDAIFIESPTGNEMLIDGGADQKVLEEISKILPYYDKKIDVILSTHPDKDHLGGLVEVLKRYESDYIIDPGVSTNSKTYASWEDAVAKTKNGKIVARRGMNVRLGGGVSFLILFPDRDVSGVNSNDASVVGKLVFGDTEFILSGDSSKKIEEYLVSLDDNFLKSIVLKAGHHGSKTSNSKIFVEKINPRYVVIQAGKENNYGHPHRESLDVFAEVGAEVLGTYERGTILMESDGKKLEIKS